MNIVQFAPLIFLAIFLGVSLLLNSRLRKKRPDVYSYRWGYAMGVFSIVITAFVCSALSPFTWIVIFAPVASVSFFILLRHRWAIIALSVLGFPLMLLPFINFQTPISTNLILELIIPSAILCAINYFYLRKRWRELC